MTEELLSWQLRLSIVACSWRQTGGSKLWCPPTWARGSPSLCGAPMCARSPDFHHEHATATSFGVHKLQLLRSGVVTGWCSVLSAFVLILPAGLPVPPGPRCRAPQCVEHARSVGGRFAQGAGTYSCVMMLAMGRGVPQVASYLDAYEPMLRKRDAECNTALSAIDPRPAFQSKLVQSKLTTVA